MDLSRTGGSTGCGGRVLLAGVLLSGLAAVPVASDQAKASPATDQPTPAVVENPHPRQKTILKREWGVEPMGVKLTAAGYMLEFRYKVLDEEKAKPLFARLTKPYLFHERTGKALAVPRQATTGPLRNSDPPIRDRIYWMFFANAGHLVKPGEKVSIVIGDFRADGIVVE